MNSSKSLQQITTDLKLAIDQIGSSVKNASDKILELARLLDESGQCERRSISRKIKELLADKIKEGKITAKWIHDCLPSEYKREYKREVTSLSDNDIKKKEYNIDSQSDGSLIVQEIDGNDKYGDDDIENEEHDTSKSNIESHITIASNYDDIDKIQSLKEEPNNNSQTLQQELSKKIELISQLQLQNKDLSDQLEAQTKKNNNNNYDSNGSVRSNSRISDSNNIHTATTQFEFPVLFDDLRQCLENIYRKTKGVGKIWIRLQTHGKKVNLTIFDGNREYQLLSEGFKMKMDNDTCDDSDRLHGFVKVFTD
jgi:hypothetical protein